MEMKCICGRTGWARPITQPRAALWCSRAYSRRSWKFKHSNEEQHSIDSVYHGKCLLCCICWIWLCWAQHQLAETTGCYSCLRIPNFMAIENKSLKSASAFITCTDCSSSQITEELTPWWTEQLLQLTGAGAFGFWLRIVVNTKNDDVWIRIGL